jgi:hypothetical protein
MMKGWPHDCSLAMIRPIEKNFASREVAYRIGRKHDRMCEKSRREKN